MKPKKINNSLKSFSKIINLLFLIIVYIDMILLNVIIGYDRGEEFYHYYYLIATSIIASFSILVSEEKYKRSFIIYYLNKVVIFAHKNKILLVIILFGIPIAYINIFE